MGNVQWFDAASVIAATSSASSEAADSPASRMAIVGPRFERCWRSTGTGGQSGTISFTGGSQAVLGFALYNFNASSITIGGTSYTVSQDFDGMGKLFKAVAFSAGSVSWSIPGGQETFDEATNYKIGRLLFVKTLNELEQNPESITREIRDPQLTVDSELGVYDTLPAGSAYGVETWQGRWLSDNLPNVKGLMVKRAHQWVGEYRNFLDRDYEFDFKRKLSGTRLTYGQTVVDIEATLRRAD